MRVASTEGFAVGWYGKIPGTSDSVARRMPSSFRDPWDRWLHSVLEGSRQRLGARWQEAFLSMPVWRFVLGPGLIGSCGWAGLLVPSVDAVGRYFPLTVAAELSPSVDAVSTLLGARGWFDPIEAIALEAIGPNSDTATIDAALAQLRFAPDGLRAAEASDATLPVRGEKPQALCVGLAAAPAEASPRLRALAARLCEPHSAWLTEPSELSGRTLLLCEGLPAGAQFGAMMDGRWLEHGWARRELGATSA